MFDLIISQTSPGFLLVCSTSLLKTMWANEKLLVTSSFFFSHSVFYLFGELFIKFEIFVCKHFQVMKSLKFVVWERVHLTLSETSPVFCVSAVQVFRKHCGKRRNCSYSVFPTVFSILLENFLPFYSNLKLSSVSSFSLEV